MTPDPITIGSRVRYRIQPEDPAREAEVVWIERVDTPGADVGKPVSEVSHHAINTGSDTYVFDLSNEEWIYGSQLELEQ